MTEPLGTQDELRMHAGREAALLSEVAALLRKLHPQARRLPHVHLQARLDRDLGFDSLSRMELLAQLESRFRLTIREQDGFAAETPAELLMLLETASPRGAPAPASALPLASAQPLDVPEGVHTLPELLRWHAQRHPDRRHVRFEGGDADGFELSYGALHDAAARAAGGLQSLGLVPGEPVALMLPTHPDFLIGFFAVQLAGGVPVPLYPPVRLSGIADYWRRQAGILRNCAARLLVTDATMYAHRRLVGSLTGSVERFVTIAELGAGAAALDSVAIQPSDLALLQYTSGSTADPKGVMLTHENLLTNLRTMGEAVDLTERDVVVSWLPLHHDMGLIGTWLGALYFGAPLVLMAPQGFLLRPERWLWAIHRYRGTISAAPNFAYELSTHRIDDRDLEGLDLRRWRLALCGAEPVMPETIEHFCERFSRYGFQREGFYPVYGLAENTLALTFPPIGRGPRILRVERDRFLDSGVAKPCASEGATLAFVSCGTPIAAHEVRIVDEADREVPDGQQGSIQFRGPSATQGYYRNPGATAKLLHGIWRDSGDLGFRVSGELYLTGRVKDLIIRAGRNIHPHGIEDAIGKIPGVRRGRVVVFGTYARHEGTERLVVIAETRLRETAGLDALRSRISTVTADVTGSPADEIVLAAPGSLLKTSSGKLRRSACRAAYESGRLGGVGGGTLFMLFALGLRDRMRSRLRRIGALAFGAYAWVVFALLVAAASTTIVLTRSLATRWRVLHGLSKAFWLAMRTPLDIKTRAPIPREPCIFVANHASYLDVIVLGCVLPRAVVFVAKAELAESPILGRLLRRLGVVYVARFDPEKCMEVVLQAATAGRDFFFFPEGTFRRMPGLLPFHLGAFLAAAQSGTPIVPIALRGTRSMLRGEDRLPHRGPIGVVVGAPIHPVASDDLFREGLRLSAEARRFILAHCDEPDLDETAMPDAGDKPRLTPPGHPPHRATPPPPPPDRR